ncbi:hypothetical protein ES708_18114 [subsurface metagenome]
MVAGYADARILDFDHYGLLILPCSDCNRATFGEFDGIAQKIHEDPFGLVHVEIEEWYADLPYVPQFYPFSLRDILEYCHDVPNRFVQVHGSQAQLHLTGLELREIEHLIDHVEQLEAISIHLADEAQLLRGQVSHIALVETLNRTDYRGEGRAHLVAHIGEEL